MRKKKAALVAVIYICSNPIITDEITPKSMQSEDGIKEPSI